MVLKMKENNLQIKKKIRHALKITEDVEPEYKKFAFAAVLGYLLQKGKIAPKAEVKPIARKEIKRLTLNERILELRDEGFFKEPKSLGDVGAELRNRGYLYSVAHVNVALLRLLRKRGLRRVLEIKAKKKMFLYVNP